MQKNIIVITGGPGTGKSTIIEGLVEKGYACHPEISREITLQSQREGIEQLFLQDPMLFSKKLLEGRKKQFISALEQEDKLVFLDRGIPDVLAYMNFIGDAYPPEFHETCAAHQYQKVFILPPWQEIYTSDQARYENYEQSEIIYTHLKDTYESYGYELIEVPKDTVESRILFILEHLSK